MKKLIAVLLAAVMMLMTFASASEIDLDSIGKSLFDYFGGIIRQSEEETEDKTGSGDAGSIGKSLIEQFGGFMQSVIDESAADSSDITDEEGETEESPEAAPESVWENILLLGCDARDDSMRTRTDSMVILSINSAEGQVKMTSLMRDTWMQVSGKSGHHKLTEFNVWGGPEMTMRAINENYGTNLEKYMLVNMKGIAQIIDILGGVDIEISEDERKYINQRLKNEPYYGTNSDPVEESGLVHLNGAQALAYVRIRYLDSDYVRTERQRGMLVALAKNIFDSFDMKKIIELIDVFGDLVETNLSTMDLIRLAGTAMNLDLNSLEQFRVPADGTFDSGTYSGTWSIRPNFTKNAKLLHEFIYGE